MANEKKAVIIYLEDREKAALVAFCKNRGYSLAGFVRSAALERAQREGLTAWQAADTSASET